MNRITLTTDGACIRNPGPGGWAYVIRNEDHTKALSGFESHTTNNRMELRAVIEGLRALEEPCAVLVRTDSRYVKNGITRWIHVWKLKKWVTAEQQPVKNRDLWEELEQLQGMHQVKWEWIRGHANDADNKLCDLLANNAARSRSGS
jgi:ribonuclease HI